MCPPCAFSLSITEYFTYTHNQMPHEKQPSSGSPEDIPDQERESSIPSELYNEGRADETRQSELSITSAEALTVYISELETAYGNRLAELFITCVHNLDTTEQDFIRSDEEIRNKVAFALQEFGIDHDVLYFGDYRKSAYVAKKPEIARHAMELAAKAIEVDETFQAYAADIARTTGALHIPGPVKDMHRIAEKMETDYLSEMSNEEVVLDRLSARVRDAARCRLVVDGDPTVADESIIAMIEEVGLHIAEDEHHNPWIRRGFRDKDSGEPLNIESVKDYRDTKVTVTVEVPTGDGGVALCEIAIVTPEMAVATVSEHPVYEIIRSFDSDDARRSVLVIIRELRGLQEAFYGGVSQQISSRLAAQTE